MREPPASVAHISYILGDQERVSETCENDAPVPLFAPTGKYRTFFFFLFFFSFSFSSGGERGDIR